MVNPFKLFGRNKEKPEEPPVKKETTVELTARYKREWEQRYKNAGD